MFQNIISHFKCYPRLSKSLVIISSWSIISCIVQWWIKRFRQTDRWTIITRNKSKFDVVYFPKKKKEILLDLSSSWNREKATWSWEGANRDPDVRRFLWFFMDVVPVAHSQGLRFRFRFITPCELPTMIEWCHRSNIWSIFPIRFLYEFFL